MCMRGDCQFKTLFAVLVLTAAVAQIHGQGKNLVILWGGWEYFVGIVQLTSLCQTIYEAKGELSAGQRRRVQHCQIYKCVRGGASTVGSLQID